MSLMFGCWVVGHPSYFPVFPPRRGLHKFTGRCLPSRGCVAWGLHPSTSSRFGSEACRVPLPPSHSFRRVSMSTTQVLKVPFSSGRTLQGTWPSEISQEPLPPTSWAHGVMEISAFPLLSDICRPSGPVRSRSLASNGFPSTGGLWPEAARPYGSEVTVTGVTCVCWTFDICSMLQFFLLVGTGSPLMLATRSVHSTGSCVGTEKIPEPSGQRGEGLSCKWEFLSGVNGTEARIQIRQQRPSPGTQGPWHRNQDK